MSLSSSLFTGTSGLKNMGNALQVVGNNIANLNTVGFKKGRSTFADTLYESVATQAGTDQMGRGMAVGDVSQNFSQGSFESTGNTTDLSIGGDGFFIMRQSNSENTFYTRAGNFFFNKGGELVNPEGYVVQGWELDEETGDDQGAIKDLVLRAFTNPPKKSTQITAITNLDADALSKSIVLSNSWDSSNDPNIASNQYEYPTVLKVYDSLGSTHDVTVLYDKKSDTEWEYVVTCNPEEDNRNSVQGTDSKGLLARGTILFSQSSGDILDITMSEFTGRLGNFNAAGINTTDDIKYEILNYEAMPDDGYGFQFEFDGSGWNFADVDKNGTIDPTEIPAKYANAVVVSSTSQEIRLIMNQTSAAQTDPDLIIKLAQPAVGSDTIGFDINKADGLHQQAIDSPQYDGQAKSNTKYDINDPSVMTHDSSGLGIVWNPSAGATEEGEWFWSNPEVANSAGTLVSGEAMTDDAGATVVMATVSAATTVLNATDMDMVASNIKTRYEGTDWDWNDDVKEIDFDPDYSNLIGSNTPSLKVLTAGSEGAIASDTSLDTPELFWRGADWSLTSSGAVVTANTLIGNTNMSISTASTSSSAIFNIWYAAGGSAGASTIAYTFTTPMSTASGQSIAFTMDPTPPKEYSNAVLTQSTAAASLDAYYIDFDGNNTQDIFVTPTAGTGAAMVDGYRFTFGVDPDVPPAEYLNATLKGDKTEAVIDLDGSGNETDKDDLRFYFDDVLPSGPNTLMATDRAKISFNILGSTAWTEISKNDIQDTGFFSFKTDFLGGEYGATETDIEFNMGSTYDGVSFINDSLSSTQYAKSSSTVYQDANGYSAGDLQGVDVASDGIITGVYSNGQLIPLFRVGLAKFLNNYGLRNEGGNLFRETRDSGGAITNKPGENGLGTIAPNSLEMSNVDISEEFVALITNQRGFQANSKTITTVDDMMSTVIQMKR
jgi:flagellar hook-basal body protein